MQHYSYSIALRVWHPSMDPKFITSTLRIEPKRTFLAGQRRSTPQGTMLSGVYAESYWHADPFNYGEYLSADECIEDTISALLKVLEPHAAFLREVRGSGGRTVVQVNSYSHRNYALELPPEILGALSSLGLSFAHDVYPCAQG